MKTKSFSKRIVSAMVAMIMLIAVVPSVSVLAREYAADVSINGVTVQFENEPYSKNDIIYVPLEEIGGYLNLNITKEGNVFNIARMGQNLKVESGNLVAFLDGKEVMLSTNPVEKNSVTYVPVDLFSAGFGCPVTISEDNRSADIVPNVYRVSITEQSAAAVSASVPDKDVLGTGTSSVDTIFNNAAVFPQLEKSLFYMIDLSAFKGLKLEKALLSINIDKSEYNPTLRIERTAPWVKGTVTYNTQPVSYESEYVTGLVAESNYVDKQYNIITLVNAAQSAGETLAIKLMGIPHSSKKNSKNNSFTIRGVNHAKAPYVEIYVDEEYIFPVKADTDTKEAEADRYNELALLKSLGVFTEQDEFPLDLSEGVQRQEFVRYALRLRNASLQDGSGEQFFSDVPTDAPFYKEVMTAHAMGLVSGWQGIAFRPYDRITVGEAITILGRMLNYNIFADERGGFTPGYFAAARQGDLYRGAEIEKEELSFKKMFTLFEDALDAKMLDVRTYHTDGSAEYIFNENMTVLSEFWDAKKIEGTVTANEYSNITPGASGKDGTIVIGTKELKLFFEPYNQFLGYKVRGWYNSEDELLYLGILESNITEVNLADIEGKGDSATTVTFTYKKENGNRKSESFSKTNVIYNGKSIASTDVTSALLNADGGSVIIVGTSLTVINAYETVTVYSTEPDEEIIYDKYDSYNNVLRLNGKDYTIRDTQGKDVEISALSPDDILSVAKSFDGELINAIVSTRKVSGTITLAENLGTPDQILTIGAAEYETRNLDRVVTDSISEYWTDYIKLGANGTFLIDAFGSIVGFNPTKTTDVKGYIVAMDTKGSAISKKLQAAVMVEGVEDYVIYELADKIELDGQRQSDSSTILSKFMETVDVTVDNDGDGVADKDSDGNEITQEVTQFKTQGIIFDLNSDGKINKIDTAYFDEEHEDEDNSLHLRRSISDGTLRYKSNGSWGGKYYVKLGSGLGVFCYDEGNLDEYAVKTSGLSNDGLYAFDLYTVGKETPQAAITYRVINTKSDASVGDDPRLMLVDKVVTAFDDDGYEIKKLYYFNGTSRSSVTVPDEMVPKLKAKVLASDDPGYADDPGNAKVVDEISRGDIIRLEADDRGELTAIEEAYDYATKTIRDNRISSFNTLVRTYGGYTGIVNGSYIKITLDSDISDAGTYTWIDSSKFSNFCRYEVTSTGVDVIPATLADVRSVKNVPYNPTGILLQAAYENLRANVWLINLVQPDNTGIYKLTYSAAAADASDTTIAGIPTTFERYNSGDLAYVSDAIPTRRNHTFIGWKVRGGDGTLYTADGDPVPVSGDTVLEAAWVYTPTYEITFKDAVSGFSYSVEWAAKDENLQDKVNNLPNAAAAATEGMTRNGYELIGWKQGTDTYEVGADYIVTGPVTFEAIWMQNWSGSAATVAPALVEGYYQITTAEELAWFSEQVKTTANLKAKLVNDIYLNNFVDCGDGKQIDTTTADWYDTSANVTAANDWTSFTIDAFAGEFDGNNKTIYGLYMKGGSGIGFFSSVAGGSVKNVTFKGAYVVSTSTENKNVHPVAVVCAETSGTTSFTNVKTYGEIKADSGRYIASSGSIIGKAGNSASCVTNVTNCYSNVRFDGIDGGTSLASAGNFGIGGIVGTVKDSAGVTLNIDNCTYEGNIIVPYHWKVGGILGNVLKGNVTISNCTNKGKIRANKNYGQIYGYKNSGISVTTSNNTSSGTAGAYDPTENLD